jgi:hypothetical protein
MKKAAIWILAVVIGLVAALYFLQMVASERVEVVELHTLDENNSTVITRLWVVDHEGLQYLRAGAGESGWSGRALANGKIKMTRNNETHSYRVEPQPLLKDKINQLMNDKYTWGDDLISVLVGTRENALPIALLAP